MCVSVCVHVLVPMEARRGIIHLGAGVTGGCELLDVGAGHCTLVLCKKSTQSLVHPSSPCLVLFLEEFYVYK